MNLTAEIVKSLREKSGEGLLSCKAALLAHNGDIEGALEHLRCQGQAVVRKGINAKQPCGCSVSRSSPE